MKKALIVLAVVAVAVAAFFLFSCGTNSAGTQVAAQRVYNGAGKVGDYITFEVDSDTLTWRYTNLTTPETLTGSYSVQSNGTYLATVEGTNRTFTILEVPETALVCPVSTESGKMIMVSTLKGSFTQADLLGTYVYVDFYVGGWGTYEVKANNTIDFSLYAVATPELTLITRETGVAYTYNSDGTITFAAWPGTRVMVSPNGVMVIDNGPGLGMAIGVKQSTASLASGIGTYACMDESSGLIGLCTIESAARMTWDWGPTEGGGTLSQIIPGVWRYAETDNLAANYPAVSICLPGQVFVGCQNIGLDTDGYVAVKL